MRNKTAMDGWEGGNERMADTIDGDTKTPEHETLLFKTKKTASTKTLHADESPYLSDLQKPFKNVDDVFDSLGKPGRYSTVIFLLLTLNNFTISPNHAIGVFIGYSPPHECRPFPNNHSTDFTTPYTHGRSIYSLNSSLVIDVGNETSPMENMTYFQCKAVLQTRGSKEEVRHCERGQWKYDVMDGESTSVTEWNLVCDRAFLANLANTFYYIGVMVGGILFGYISDVYGRKVALLLSLYSTVGVGVAIVLARQLTAFFALRTIMGVAIQGLQTSSYIRLVEMFTPRYRSIYVTMYTVFWSVAFVGLGLAAWALKDWRMIQIAVIGQACIAGLYLWLVPESLRWLISQGNEEQASRLVQRIARINGISPDPRYNKGSLVQDEAAGKVKERASYMDLVRTPQLRRRTCLMCYITFATNMGYWGLTYNTTAMVGNKYLNFTLGSVAEAIMSVANVFVISRFGKKKALISYFLCGGVCCIVMSCLITETLEPYATIVMVISTLGRLTTAGLFVANDLYMAELFPTVVRNMGVGVCTFMGRIGAVFTPLIFTAGLYTFQHLPLLVFGLITFAGGLLTFMLPETGKLKLPETLEDVIIVEAPIQSEKTTKNDIATQLNSFGKNSEAHVDV